MPKKNKQKSVIPRGNLDYCQKCGRVIVWRKTHWGRWEPFEVGIHNITPSMVGRITAMTTDGKTIRGNYSPKAGPNTVRAMVFHKAYCRDEEQDNPSNSSVDQLPF